MIDKPWIFWPLLGVLYSGNILIMASSRSVNKDILPPIQLMPLEQKFREHQTVLASTLAPSPIFPPLGLPQACRVTVKGRDYAVIWDGHELTIREIKKTWRERLMRYIPNLSGGLWIFPFVVLGAIAWTGIFMFIFSHIHIFINIAIGVLAAAWIGLTVHIWRRLK